MGGIIEKIYGKISYIKNLWLFKYVDTDICIPTKVILNKKDVKNKYEKIHQYYPSVDFVKAVEEKAGKTEKAGVIFNSGKILKRENGKEIDREDVVVRVNFMPTRGYEKKVGSRTTIRVLGREWIFSEKGELMVHTYNSEDYFKSDVKNMEKSRKLRKAKLYICKSKHIDSFFNSYLGGMMTNGFRAVILALSVCDHVTIYGADPAGASSDNENGSISKFPTEEDEKYIKRESKKWNIDQNIERYFNPIEKGRQSEKLHSTLENEYSFYEKHPRVDMKNVN